MKVNIIGAGLGGCEAALTLSNYNIDVKLFDIKPNGFTPAHSNPDFAELVCSNSLKSNAPSTSGGLLKQELRMLKSPLISIADRCAVPAGSALAVDRVLFAKEVTKEIFSRKNIEFISKEVVDIDADSYTIIATGPLTTDNLFNSLSKLTGERLHFYDAAAPIISGESINRAKTFTADRYGKGEGDYINCSMTEDEYKAFYTELISAECATLKDFEKSEIFEGCMPIEVMAKRGYNTLLFGPMRPVGFRDADDKRPFAVIQLRKENSAGDMYNIVGFQTNLKFAEQKRVFSLVPALNDAQFLRYGVMHRNSYINAPKVLTRRFNLKNNDKIYIAGQLSGVEGYVESIMSGLLSALDIAYKLNGKEFPLLPDECITGALPAYLERQNSSFQPMNANFGLLPPIEERIKDKQLKKLKYYDRSVLELKKILLPLID